MPMDTQSFDQVKIERLFFSGLLHKALLWYKIPFLVPACQMEARRKMKARAVPFN